jgi:hypothetical protein
MSEEKWNIILLGIVFITILLYCLPFILSNRSEIPNSSDKKNNSNQNINVSTNIIRYPSSVKCENCEKHVYPVFKSIDSSTWDLKCSCGFIAYKHPLREERIEQIKNLLD